MVFEEVPCAESPHVLKVLGQCNRPSPRAVCQPMFRLLCNRNGPSFPGEAKFFPVARFCTYRVLTGCSPIPPLSYSPLWFREPTLTVAQAVLGSGALSVTFTEPFLFHHFPACVTPTAIWLGHQTVQGRNHLLQPVGWTSDATSWPT